MFPFIQLESLQIYYTHDEGASEKTRDSVVPGEPFIELSAKPAVEIVLENPYQRSGLFTISSDISNGDTTQSLNDKIMKNVGLKGKTNTQQKFCKIQFIYILILLQTLMRYAFGVMKIQC